MVPLGRTNLLENQQFKSNKNKMLSPFGLGIGFLMRILCYKLLTKRATNIQ